MLYIVRHGQTDWNKDKVMQGQTDIPLNSIGITQAKLAGEKLKHKKFDAIYCSPLTRAKQTLDNLGIELNNVIYDDRLKERNYGEFEKQLKSSFNYNEFWNLGLDKKYKEAESCKEFFDRVINFLEDITKHHAQILIVTHAGITKVCKYYFEGLKDEEIGPYLPNNAEVLTYEF